MFDQVNPEDLITLKSHHRYPGSTHHGQPMEKIPMGHTQLPLEVILEYLESLKAIYTMEVM